MKNTMILTANMGSCECGNVHTRVLIDDEKKIIITEPDPWYSWKQGDFADGEFHVPYCKSTGLMKKDYSHVVRNFTDEEKELFN